MTEIPNNKLPQRHGSIKNEIKDLIVNKKNINQLIAKLITKSINHHHQIKTH